MKTLLDLRWPPAVARADAAMRKPLCPPSPPSPPSPASSRGGQEREEEEQEEGLDLDQGQEGGPSSPAARRARLALGHVDSVYPADCTATGRACSLSRIKLCWAAEHAGGGGGGSFGPGPGGASGPLGGHLSGSLGPAALGASRCPSARLRVEKIEGGLLVAGVVVAANCQLALPAFGCLFLLAGCVLTAASYRGPGSDEGPENYAARIAFTGNSRVLGPACLSVGLLMLLAGGALCLLARRARRRETRLAFHCPLHGDFYPLSPVTAYGPQRRAHGKRWLCRWWGRSSKTEVETTTPKCPHSTVSSSRSSVSSAPPSPCPTPLPFLVTEGSVSGLVASAGALVSPDQTFGSIRSLSVSREVASFPLSRTPSPPSTIERKSGSPSPPLAQQQQPASHVDELILATARRLELPPLVRQEVTLVSPGAMPSAMASSASIMPSSSSAAAAAQGVVGFATSPSSASLTQPGEDRAARPATATRKSVSILLPEKGRV
ncbi:Triple functional domain protein [Frankliniella fusca]|uniref:Triple functional domain protein n=1 Tax=Frankliniella fusca TaxID=407009 RepID=A0AAE1L875_9NEOP|nr:Triple functional domain protein [Frankliniella fusca]